MTFYKLEKNPDILYGINKTFLENSRLQGSGMGQIVPNTIEQKDLNKHPTLESIVFGIKKPSDLLDRFSAGDICLYAPMFNNIKTPISYSEDTVLLMESNRKCSISVNNKEYYTELKSYRDSEANQRAILSKNLYLDFTNSKFHFKTTTELSQLGCDAAFLLDVNKNKNITIDGETLFFGELIIPDKIKKELSFYVEAKNVLEQLHIMPDISFNDFTQAAIQQLKKLIEIKNDDYSETCTFVSWQFGNVYVPIWIIKDDKKQENILTNMFLANISVHLDKKESFSVPSFCHMDIETLNNLYMYPYEYFYNQINQSEINQDTLPILNETIDTFLQAFDFSKNKELLKIANYLIETIKKSGESSPIFIINELQTKKRLNIFTEDDICTLNNFRYKDWQIDFAVSVLLGDKKKASERYSKFGKNKKKEIETCAIYNLYKQLLINGPD